MHIRTRNAVPERNAWAAAPGTPRVGLERKQGVGKAGPDGSLQSDTICEDSRTKHTDTPGRVHAQPGRALGPASSLSRGAGFCSGAQGVG